MLVTLVSHTSYPAVTIESAACECYKAAPSNEHKHIKQCYRNGHHSVLEHASFTFHASGVSRACLAQLTRHRLASFSIESQRYVDYQTGFPFRTPPSIAENDDAAMLFYRAMALAGNTYNHLINLGISKEDARFVLPNATTCSLTFTMNLRELIHFCNERLCSRAQWEIRELAGEMIKLVNNVTDGGFSYMLVPKCLAVPDMPLCREGKRSCGKAPTKEVYLNAKACVARMEKGEPSNE